MQRDRPKAGQTHTRQLIVEGSSAVSGPCGSVKIRSASRNKKTFFVFLRARSAIYPEKTDADVT